MHLHGQEALPDVQALTTTGLGHHEIRRTIAQTVMMVLAQLAWDDRTKQIVPLKHNTFKRVTPLPRVPS